MENDSNDTQTYTTQQIIDRSFDSLNSEGHFYNSNSFFEKNQEWVSVEQLKENENIDSLEIGAPTKEGKLKVYFNANNVDDAKKRVDNAKEVRDYAMAAPSINV